MRSMLTRATFFVVLMPLFFMTGCAGQQMGPQKRPVGHTPPHQTEQTMPPQAHPAPVPVSPPVTYVPPSASRQIKAALLVPLSGQHQQLGQSMLDAALLALYDKQGTLSEAQHANIILLPKNTEGTVAGAKAALRESMDQKADVILGPLFTRSLKAIAPTAKRSGIPVISFSNNAKAGSRGVFTMGFMPEQQVRTIIRHAAGQGKKRIAALVPTDAYGVLIEKALTKSAREYGAEIVGIVKYPPAVPDIRSAIRRAFALGADALLFPEGGRRLLQLSELLRSGEVALGNTVLLGSGQWDDPSSLKAIGVSGGRFASAEPARRQAFEQRFQRSYGYKPPRLASLAYDAAILVASLGHNGETISAQSITNPRGFNGPADGIFRFSSGGTVERGLAVLELGRNGFALVEAAPGHFGR